jgi:hypothetical protein
MDIAGEDNYDCCDGRHGRRMHEGCREMYVFFYTLNILYF